MLNTPTEIRQKMERFRDFAREKGNLDVADRVSLALAGNHQAWLMVMRALAEKP